MGTRGAIAFVIDGVEKVTYNHFDSYPSELGEHVRNWLATEIEANNDLELKEQVRNLRLVNEDESPTDEDREHFSKFWNKNVSSGDDWYSLLRETQGNPGAILAAGAMCDASSFPRDSLFCEWAYVVDFDAEVLEVYQGFQKSPPTEGRWVGQEGSGGGYFPVQRIASWPFHALPDHETFGSTLEPADEDE